MQRRTILRETFRKIRSDDSYVDFRNFALEIRVRLSFVINISEPRESIV